MRPFYWFTNLSFALLVSAAPLAAEPIGLSAAAIKANPAATPINFTPAGRTASEQSPVFGQFGRIVLPRAPEAKPILVAGRCGSSNKYCSEPTPYCCGTGPANYYCAVNVNGCTR